ERGRCDAVEPSGGGRVDRWAPALPATYAAPFLLAHPLFFFFFFAASRPHPTAPKRPGFSRVALRCPLDLARAFSGSPRFSFLPEQRFGAAARLVGIHAHYWNSM